MKANVTYLPVMEVIALAQSMGLKVEAQVGFYKITGPIPGKAFYASNGKTVGRIDVSGFGEKILPGCTKHPKPPTKRVTMIVNQENLDSNAIKENLKVLFEMVRGPLAIAAEK